VRILKILNKRIRHEDEGVQIAGHINAAIAGNVGEGSAHTHVSSHQRVVQTSQARATAGGKKPVRDDDLEREERSSE
jgi:hypothetical protein